MKKAFWLVKGKLCGRPGPAEAPWDVKELYDGGIRTIISLDQDNVNHKAIVEAGIEHISFTLPDSIPPTKDDARLWQDILPVALNYIKKRMSDGSGAILVHCWAGKDRTGMLLGSFLTLVEGLKPKEAFLKLREVRPVALSSEGYEEFFLELMQQIKTQK